MSRLRGLLILAPLLGALAAPAAAGTPTSPVLLTLEWPPYTGMKLPGEGWNSQRVRQAYAALGKPVRIGFFSWRRTFTLPYADRRFAGYFPEYPSSDREQICNFSAAIGTSVVGIVERRDKPLQWRTVDDLTHYRIGVVEDYVNEERFDQLMGQGNVTVTKSVDDAHNLLNLLRGKADGAIMDTRVFDWLLRNDPQLAGAQGKLQMNARPLRTWPLVVCFRKDANGAAMRDEFNAGLARLPPEEPPPQAPAAKTGSAAAANYLPAG